MKKLIICVLILALSLVAFVGCDMNTTTEPSVGSDPVIDPNPTPNPNPKPTPVYLNSVALESGKYMVGDIVYTFHKGSKVIELMQYNSYAEYKTQHGARLFEGAVQYVKSAYADECVYFEFNNKDYYLTLENDKPKLYIASGSSYNSTFMSTIGDTIAEPENGTYVSGKQEQTVNGIKEEFFVFIEITDTKASLYVSNTNATYDGEPLHTIDNYVEEFVNGYVRIRIPHQNGSYTCNVTFMQDGVRFVNSYETAGDYSCSGTLTKIA